MAKNKDSLSQMWANEWKNLQGKKWASNEIMVRAAFIDGLAIGYRMAIEEEINKSHEKD